MVTGTDQRAEAVLGDARFTAFLFDLDGVVTDTASLHARAWRRMFDELLAERGLRAFSDEDYRAHVDGRSRIDGVTAVLESRGLTLPLGSPHDPPGATTRWGLAARKDRYYRDLLAAEGAPVFASTVSLVRRLKAGGVGTALVSASRNAGTVLDAAGIADLFDVRVDGVDADRDGLPGKPDPALFREAARRLGVEPPDAVVVEDALAGVAAGRAGGFGLVVGVDRDGQAAALRERGAQVVVADLAELTVDAPDPGCALCAVPEDAWSLHYRGDDPAVEGTREALTTLGNGYLGTRGAHPEAVADGVHYPGVYVAGVYNRLTSEVDGHTREDESLVNLPNWLPLIFRPQGGSWFPARTEVLHAHRLFDLRNGVLLRETVVRDAEGRRTRLRQRRLVSLAQPHLAALETTLLPENWSGVLDVRSGIDGAVRNGNVAEFADLAGTHLTITETGETTPDTVRLVAETGQSRVRVALCARTRVRRAGTEIRPERALRESVSSVGHELTLAVTEGEEVTVEKVVAVHTSRDRGISEPASAAAALAARAPDFGTVLGAHSAAWRQGVSALSLALSDGDDVQLAVTLHTAHLLQTVSPNTVDLDVGVPARGLHGEGYRGHIFWDEMFVLPFLDFRLPDLSRSLLRYRHRRLGAAKALAADLGLKGALYPWQSGSDGREETPRALFNPRSGRWMPDHSRRQYHVNLAVAYNVWHHWETTADWGFLGSFGAELLVEIARFWAGIATYDSAADRYDVRGVMGPDEFHDGYPDEPGRGIDNSTYVNIMTAWVLGRALDACALIGPEHGSGLWARLSLTDAELARWEHMRTRLRLCFLDNGLLSQFEGFGELAELDWDAYRARYGNIGRLDLILEAEGDSTNRYQASKQADVLMLLYLFTADELAELVRGIGYDFDPAVIPATVEYYLSRTSHGSTLSRVAHAWVLSRTNRRGSWRMLGEALRADLRDTQGGTTREGIHLGAMAGTLDILQRCYTGLDIRCGGLWFHPALPDELEALSFDLHYRNQWITVRVDHRTLSLCARPGAAPPVQVTVDTTSYALAAGETLTVELDPALSADR